MQQKITKQSKKIEKNFLTIIFLFGIILDVLIILGYSQVGKAPDSDSGIS